MLQPYPTDPVFPLRDAIGRVTVTDDEHRVSSHPITVRSATDTHAVVSPIDERGRTVRYVAARVPTDAVEVELSDADILRLGRATMSARGWVPLSDILGSPTPAGGAA